MVRSIYSSALTNSSQMYCRQGNCVSLMFYYEAIEINVTMTGNYTILCNSTKDTYGYIYNNSFDPSFPNQNLLSFNDDGGGDQQFIFRTFLQTITQYILVVTTNRVSVTGAFSIIATGPELLSFSKINISSKNSSCLRKPLQSNEAIIERRIC